MKEGQHYRVQVLHDGHQDGSYADGARRRGGRSIRAPLDSDDLYLELPGTARVRGHARVGITAACHGAVGGLSPT